MNEAELRDENRRLEKAVDEMHATLNRVFEELAEMKAMKRCSHCGTERRLACAS